MVILMPMRTATTTQIVLEEVGEAPEEGVMGGAVSKVVVGAKAEDQHATKRRGPMIHLSALPNKCLP